MTKHPYDIRVNKRELRQRYKSNRIAMNPDEKRVCDARIRGRVLHLPEYLQCKTLLCFVSTPIEVETHKLISRAISDGKVVAVPYCLEGTRKMEFYRIRSLNDLRPRTFGVLEPVAEQAERLTDFKNSLCILPGIAFDHSGYRLGYGGGYYDRFLSKVYRGKGGVTAGVCYSGCMARRLPRGRFDVPCDILITERYVRRLAPPEGKRRQESRGKGKSPS